MQVVYQGALQVVPGPVSPLLSSLATFPALVAGVGATQDQLAAGLTWGWVDLAAGLTWA